MESDIQDLSFRGAILRRDSRSGRHWDPTIMRTPDGRFTNLALIFSDQCPWSCEIRVDGDAEYVATGSVLEQIHVVGQQVASVRRRLSEEADSRGCGPGEDHGDLPRRHDEAGGQLQGAHEEPASDRHPGVHGVQEHGRARNGGRQESLSQLLVQTRGHRRGFVERQPPRHGGARLRLRGQEM